MRALFVFHFDTRYEALAIECNGLDAFANDLLARKCAGGIQVPF
jgi:hypothetical protein